MARRSPKNTATLVGDAERIAERRRQVMQLIAGHLTQEEIAKRIGVSQTTVCFDIKAMREEWKQRFATDFDEFRERETAGMEQLENELLAKWRETDDPRYVAEITKLKDRKHRLVGLNKPDKIAPTTPDGEDPWEGVADDQLARQLAKLLEERS